jgi:hypothetical protein
VILVMMAFLILHEATAIWDVRYASATREVSPTEQHVHSVLEMLPFTGLLLVIALHWPDFTALFGFGRPDFSFMLKQQPIPVAYVVTMLTLTALLEVLPIWKSWRAGCVTIGRARIKWANAGSMTRQEPKGGTTTTGLPSAVGLAGRALRPKRNWQQSPCTASVVTWHDAMIGIAPYKMSRHPRCPYRVPGNPKRAVASHGGRIANTAGDRVLAEFESAVDAIRCATEAQGALARANSPLPETRHINFRIGVHDCQPMAVKALESDGVGGASRPRARAWGLGGSAASGSGVSHVF